MKPIVKVATLLSLSAATLLASGWRIPEQSLNSTALSAAYVASASGADASYYNPANMAFMADGAEIETAVTYINLPKIKYTDSTGFVNDSKEEHFIMPTMHYVSPKQGNFRYGLSIVAPGGLSKRWDEAYGMATAEEFTLKIIEVNPTVSYLVNDKFAIGLGLRALYSEGVVKSDANGVGSDLTRNMEGDSIDFGYNLALSYKPINDLIFSATYRSKVDLTEKGNASLFSADLLGPGSGGSYDGSTTLSVPLPASLALAAAYTIDKTTVEFVFERTYWSAYKGLDFNYDGTITSPILTLKFDDYKPRNWKDANAYRIGITHQYNDKLKLMAGFAIDKNGAPDNTLAFELPDSDAKLYSVGFEYKLSEKMKIGLAYLYDQKESRTVYNRSGTEPTAPNGTFENASAHLVTASLKYKF
jgi:long-chain fatty acid transport protein